MAFRLVLEHHTVSQRTIRAAALLQNLTFDTLEPVQLNGKSADVYLRIASREQALQIG